MVRVDSNSYNIATRCYYPIHFLPCSINNPYAAYYNYHAHTRYRDLADFDSLIYGTVFSPVLVTPALQYWYKYPSRAALNPSK